MPTDKQSTVNNTLLPLSIILINTTIIPNNLTSITVLLKHTDAFF